MVVMVTGTQCRTVVRSFHVRGRIVRTARKREFPHKKISF